MTISTTFLTPPSAILTHPSGRQYKANSSGIVTVPTPDDSAVGGVGSAAIPLFQTGATTDRPLPTYGWGAKTPYYDTTTASFVFYVGALSTTGWVNSTGSAV